MYLSWVASSYSNSTSTGARQAKTCRALFFARYPVYPTDASLFEPAQKAILEVSVDLGAVVKSVSLVCVLVLLGAQSALSQQPKAPAAASVRVPVNVRAALVFEQQGKITEAEAQWKLVVKTQPGNAQAYAHLGLLEARQKNYSEAIRFYRKAEALNPAIAELKLNLGLALFKSEKFQEAGKAFESGLKDRPNPADKQRLTILAAMAHYGAHEYAAAIPYLKEAASKDQQNLPLRLTLAHCYLWTKQIEATLDVYKEILLINPDSAEADMIAGEALDEKGDNAGAVQQFRAAVQANPREPNVHFGLGYLYWTQKRYDEAIVEFKAELANDPSNNQTMVYLGDTYLQQSQYEMARQMLENAARYPSKEPLIPLDLGIVYIETGNNEAAIRELDKAIALDPNNVTAHFRLAKLYQSVGKKEEAKAEFAKSSSLNKQRDDDLHRRIAEGNARPAPADQPTQSEPQH